MEDVIKAFLHVSYGDGSGDGSGKGVGNGTWGYGYGYSLGYDDGSGFVPGSGYGDGRGYGCGDGSGSSYGFGDGRVYVYDDGLISYNKQKVYIVDGIATIIDSVHANYAVGKVVKLDLTTEDVYIAKVGNHFAHGKTLSKAVSDARDKGLQKEPLAERLKEFIVQYPTLDSVAEHSDLYKWHGILTGSCQFGRDEFAKEHNLDKDNGSMTIREFIDLTVYSYGSDIIRKLKKEYETSVE